jgi:hypothetical protein
MRAHATAVTAAAAATAFCLAAARAADTLPPETLLPPHGSSDAWRPALAWCGGVYLLVWQADRNEKADIVAMRLDRNGRPMETRPFVVSAAADCQERPRIASGRDVFLVVWHDLRNGRDWDVYAARVSPAGKTLDPEGIPVARADRNQCEPDACFDGEAFQVLWRGFQGEKETSVAVGRPPAAGYHVYGGRVTPDGRLLDGDGVFMAKPVREYLTPSSMGAATAVRTPDGGLLAVARSGGALCSWRIADGRPSGPPALIPKAAGFDDPCLVTDGKGIMATWTTFRDGGGRSSGADKSGMVLLGAGGEAGAAGVQSLSSAKVAPRVRHPGSAWDGKRYVVAWDAPQRGRDIHYEAVFMRGFAADGTPLGDDQTVINDPASPGYRPALASDGAGTTVLACERHPRSPDTSVLISVRVLRQ